MSHRRLIAAAVLLLCLAVPMDAPAQVGPPFDSNPQVDTWKRVKGFKAKRSSRVIRIGVRNSCRGNAVKKRRTARALIITVTYFDAPAGQPPYYAPPLCTFNAGVVKVRLKKPLGRRAVKDGATQPHRVRYERPRRAATKDRGKRRAARGRQAGVARTTTSVVDVEKVVTSSGR